MLPAVLPDTEMLVFKVLLPPPAGAADCCTFTEPPPCLPESGSCVARAPELSRLPWICAVAAWTQSESTNESVQHRIVLFTNMRVCIFITQGCFYRMIEFQVAAETPIRLRTKHQERTEATRAKLLSAAQDVFTRDGFANARLEQIAVEAGYTRGAIYAHYKSKEDLFLGLLEQRIQASIAEFGQMIDRYPDHDERLKQLRAMLVRKASDKSWTMLVLEFKLFALRQPKLKVRLQKLMSMLKSTTATGSLGSVFGELKPKESHRVERRMALVGAVMSAAVLESHFRPELLSGKDLDAVLSELFEALIRR